MLKTFFAILALTVAGATIDKNVHDFGRIVEGSAPASCTFTLSNTGSGDLLIEQVVSSCGCTEVKWTRSVIRPGGKGTVVATYSADEGPMAFDKTLTVYLSTQKKPVVLHLRGSVVASK